MSSVILGSLTLLLPSYSLSTCVGSVSSGFVTVSEIRKTFKIETVNLTEGQQRIEDSEDKKEDRIFSLIHNPGEYRVTITAARDT